MAARERRVALLIHHGRQLGRNLLLLAHYTAVFVAFVGRGVQWIVTAVEWAGLFARTTTSAFDSVYRHLRRGRRRSVREICSTSDLQTQG